MANLVNINDTTIATDIISAFASHQMVLKQFSCIDLYHLCNNLSIRIHVCSVCMRAYTGGVCVSVCVPENNFGYHPSGAICLAVWICF